MDDYILKYTIYYHSERYGKSVTVPKGYKSDGATGAFDIYSEAWFVHDKICEFGVWDDGSLVTRHQAAKVLSDILKSEGRWFRCRSWYLMTFLFGCKKVRG